MSTTLQTYQFNNDDDDDNNETCIYYTIIQYIQQRQNKVLTDKVKLRLVFMHNNVLGSINVLLIIINYREDHKSQIQTTEIEGKDNEFPMKNNQT